MFKASYFVFNLERCCDVEFFLWGQNTKEVEMEFEQKSLVFWVVLGDVQSDRWPITFLQLLKHNMQKLFIPEGANPNIFYDHFT